MMVHFNLTAKDKSKEVYKYNTSNSRAAAYLIPIIVYLIIIYSSQGSNTLSA